MADGRHDLPDQGRPALAACLAALAASSALALLVPANGLAALAPRAAQAPTRPIRIVSLSVPADEIALAIVDDPSRIVALERFVDDPAASNATAEARRVVGRTSAAAEEVLGRRPDLVLLPRWSAPGLTALLDAEGVATCPLDTPTSIEEVRASILTLGAALDAAPAAESLVAAMDARLAAIAARTPDGPRPRVVSWSGAGLTPAGGTLFCDAVAHAGGVCAAAEQGAEGFVPLGLEALLSLDPDVVVEARYDAGGGARALGDAASLAGDPRARGLRAVRAGRVFALPTAHALATSHHVAALVDDLARVLHPEAP